MRVTRVLMVMWIAGAVSAANTFAQEPKGDAKAGQAAFGGGVAFCSLCHGGQAQGGLGPDLAGTGLTFAQFKRSVHKPWGIMPAFPQIDDQALANMLAFLSGLPKVATPAPARTLPPPDAPVGQRLAAAYGCGQCHGAEVADPRRDLGGYGDVDVEVLKRILFGERPSYERAQGKRPNRMGMYDPARIPEGVIQQIFHWLKDEQGLRVPMTAEITASAPRNDAITYTLTIDNEGEAKKGLAAETVTVSLALPAGAKVVSTTGAGYVGVQDDPTTKAPNAVWKIAKIAAAEKPQMSITLQGTEVPEGIFKGSAIRWIKPAQKRPANQTLKDPRIEPPGDWISTTGSSQRPTGAILPLIVTPPATKK